MLAFDTALIFDEWAVMLASVKAAVGLLWSVLAAFEHIWLVNVAWNVNVLVTHDFCKIVRVPIACRFKCGWFADELVLFLSMILGGLQDNTAVDVLAIWVELAIIFQIVLLQVCHLVMRGPQIIVEIVWNVIAFGGMVVHY
jgi:hypothetical protein